MILLSYCYSYRRNIANNNLAYVSVLFRINVFPKFSFHPKGVETFNKLYKTALVAKISPSNHSFNFIYLFYMLAILEYSYIAKHCNDDIIFIHAGILYGCVGCSCCGDDSHY